MDPILIADLPLLDDLPDPDPAEGDGVEDDDGEPYGDPDG
jgi:hypothetical protein|tara:strand:+ start:132 stop:251 length:120 start_codon:yes stop_codon:yes gene_type:complete